MDLDAGAAGLTVLLDDVIDMGGTILLLGYAGGGG